MFLARYLKGPKPTRNELNQGIRPGEIELFLNYLT